MAYWQKIVKSGIQNYNSNLPTVMDFTLHDAIGTVLMKTQLGTWNGESYDNFFQ
jgi:hypothetical protein